MIRWMKFNAVGLMGVMVQLTVLQGLVKLGLHYLAATAIGVEIAVLHNYVWHTHWTWKDRGPAAGGNLLRFHLGNGLLSLAANVALMKVFAGWLGMPLIPANLTAIALASILNFLVGDLWVFPNTGGRSSR